MEDNEQKKNDCSVVSSHGATSDSGNYSGSVMDSSKSINDSSRKHEPLSGNLTTSDTSECIETVIVVTDEISSDVKKVTSDKIPISLSSTDSTTSSSVNETEPFKAGGIRNSRVLSEEERNSTLTQDLAIKPKPDEVQERNASEIRNDEYNCGLNCMEGHLAFCERSESTMKAPKRAALTFKATHIVMRRKDSPRNSGPNIANISSHSSPGEVAILKETTKNYEESWIVSKDNTWPSHSINFHSHNRNQPTHNFMIEIVLSEESYINRKGYEHRFVLTKSENLQSIPLNSLKPLGEELKKVKLEHNKHLGEDFKSIPPNCHKPLEEELKKEKLKHNKHLGEDFKSILPNSHKALEKEVKKEKLKHKKHHDEDHQSTSPNSHKPFGEEVEKEKLKDNKHHGEDHQSTSPNSHKVLGEEEKEKRKHNKHDGEDFKSTSPNSHKALGEEEKGNLKHNKHHGEDFKSTSPNSHKALGKEGKEKLKHNNHHSEDFKSTSPNSHKPLGKRLYNIVTDRDDSLIVSMKNLEPVAGTEITSADDRISELSSVADQELERSTEVLERTKSNWLSSSFHNIAESDEIMVFGVGLMRTGAKSLSMALEQLLGGRCLQGMDSPLNSDHISIWLKAMENGIISATEWHHLYAGYRAAVDLPTAVVFKHLASVFPRAKFILTMREEQAWHRSIRWTTYDWGHRFKRHPFCHILPKTLLCEVQMVLNAALIYANRGASLDLRDETAALTFFRRHVAAVKATIPPERLLVFRSDEGWGPLCRFLSLPLPNTPFPEVDWFENYENCTATVVSIIGPMILIALCIAVGIFIAHY